MPSVQLTIMQFGDSRVAPIRDYVANLLKSSVRRIYIPRPDIDIEPTRAPTKPTCSRSVQMGTQRPIQFPADLNLDSIFPQFKLWAELEQAARPVNVDSLRKYLHKDFRHVILPRSIGEPERNKEQWVAHMAESFSSITMANVSKTRCHNRSTQTYFPESRL